MPHRCGHPSPHRCGQRSPHPCGHPAARVRALSTSPRSGSRPGRPHPCGVARSRRRRRLRARASLDQQSRRSSGSGARASAVKDARSRSRRRSARGSRRAGRLDRSLRRRGATPARLRMGLRAGPSPLLLLHRSSPSVERPKPDANLRPPPSHRQRLSRADVGPYHVRGRRRPPPKALRATDRPVGGSHLSRFARRSKSSAIAATSDGVLSSGRMRSSPSAPATSARSSTTL